MSILAPFSRPFPKVDFWMHFGRPLAHCWLPFGSLWLTFGALWLPFGSLWLPFGSLLGPFCSLLAPFGSLWFPFAHFWCPLVASWLPFAPFWLPFATTWQPFGSISQHLLPTLSAPAKGGISRQGRGRGKPLPQGILGKRGVDGTMGAAKPPIAQGLVGLKQKP